MGRVGIIAWLVCVGAIDASIVLFSRDHRSGTDGLFLITLGVFGGGVALLFAGLALLPARENGRRGSFALRLIVAASFFGFIGVARYRNHLYLRDQDEAKHFIEQRIAELRASDSAATWPTTQDEFVNHQPLPRLLRGQHFYFHDDGGHFHIEIPVDFDGGWMYSDSHPQWIRST